MKLVYGASKYRQIFFESIKKRQASVNTILQNQGFSSQLDQYELINEIGAGSINPVWLAESRMTGMKVALKVMDTANYERLTHEQHISEAEAMRLCQNSSHVVQLIDEFEHGDKTYVVTKFVQGGDLLTYINSLGVNCLNENLIRQIISQAAQGINDMHQVGVVHRDIKHLNIFVRTTDGQDASQNPTIKIGDFGMASKLGKNQTIEKVAGTIAFMAPEVVEGQASDFRADVWSLGIILHHLASSKLPFSGDDREETREQILNKPLNLQGPNGAKMSPQLKNLITAMLKKDQKTRISIADVLAHPWMSSP